MQGSGTSYLTFVQTVPGLETLLAAELLELGVRMKTLEGGVSGRATQAELYEICLRSRIAEHVRIRLKPFKAADFRIFREGIRGLSLHAFLPLDYPLTVKVTCHKSRLWHSGAVEERVRLELSERGYVFDDDDEEAFALYVRIVDDEVTVSVDASGARLSRRGFRKFVEKASLRESLAAAVIESLLPELGDAAERVIFDPFVGAGTLLLEARDILLGLDAGRRRRFAFERWPTFSAATLAAVREKTRPSRVKRLRLFGSDIAEKAIRSSRHNLAEAGETEATLYCGDFLKAARDVPVGAIVITNPPYGKRLREDEVGARLLDLLERRRDLRPCAILAGGLLDEKLTEYRSLFTTESGGLRVNARLLTSGGVAG